MASLISRYVPRMASLISRMASLISLIASLISRIASLISRMASLISRMASLISRMASLIRYVIGRSRSLLRTIASSSASPQLSIQMRRPKATMCMLARLPATNSVMTFLRLTARLIARLDCETDEFPH